MPFLSPSRLDRTTSFRYLLTAATVVIALVLAWFLWWHYLRAPWTRDGRVRVEVVNVASQVSGIVTKLNVIDNQKVKKDDVLFEIEQIDYKIALIEAEATVASRLFDYNNAKQEAERREKLGAAIVGLEDLNTARITSNVAESNLPVGPGRARPVQGQHGAHGHPLAGQRLRDQPHAAHRRLRHGGSDETDHGRQRFLLDRRLLRGDQAAANPRRRLRTHPADGLDARGGGATSRASPAASPTPTTTRDGQGLASVDPIFTWVRLAQRLPIRIKIDHVPEGVIIAAGQTCTVVLDHARKAEKSDTPVAVQSGAVNRSRRGYGCLCRLRATKIQATTPQMSACNVRTIRQRPKSAMCVVVDWLTMS